MSSMRIVRGPLARDLTQGAWRLTESERVFLWRIVLHGESCCLQCLIGNTADCDVNPLRPMPDLDHALRYLRRDGQIP